MWTTKKGDVSRDSLCRHKKIRGGEKIYDVQDFIEDTKGTCQHLIKSGTNDQFAGNPGERGQLVVSNIRLMWICSTNSRFSLSEFLLDQFRGFDNFPFSQRYRVPEYYGHEYEDSGVQATWHYTGTVHHDSQQ